MLYISEQFLIKINFSSSLFAGTFQLQPYSVGAGLSSARGKRIPLDVRLNSQIKKRAATVSKFRIILSVLSRQKLNKMIT
jgi:hypothetical protein